MNKQRKSENKIIAELEKLCVLVDSNCLKFLKEKSVEELLAFLKVLIKYQRFDLEATHRELKNARRSR